MHNRTTENNRDKTNALHPIKHTQTGTHAKRTTTLIMLISGCKRQHHTANDALQTAFALKPTTAPETKHANRRCCQTSANHARPHECTTVRTASKHQSQQLKEQSSIPARSSLLFTHETSTSNPARTSRHACALLRTAQQPHNSASDPLNWFLNCRPSKIKVH